MQHVIVYVDGFNLYYGLRSKNMQRYYWLDLRKVALELCRPTQKLIAIKYFTTVPKSPQDKKRRHTTYLDALQSLPDVSIYYGHFLEEEVTCRRCGYAYLTHHEKMTDVNLAVEMLVDAFLDRYDVALLISADSDLVGPVRSVHSLFPGKHVVAIFPPNRRSGTLAKATHGTKILSRAILSRSQFPDPVITPSGITLRRPTSWA
jgi:uncharacterized LabA/DUF88 family protein